MHSVNIPYDDSNIFAKILRGELPCHKTIENDLVLGFMDVFPRSLGHSLVIPKQPSRGLLDCADANIGAIFVAARQVARAARSVFAADGITIQQLNESAAGQMVFHTHVHIIPRFEGEPLPPGLGEAGDGEQLAAHAKMIRHWLQQRQP